MKILTVFLSLFTVIGYGQVMKDNLALHQWIFDIRDPQTDAKTFRSSLHKIGAFLATEVSEYLLTKKGDIETLTGSPAHPALFNETPVLITLFGVDRSLLQGVQEVFPNAEVGVLGVAQNGQTLLFQTDSSAILGVEGKTVILVDTMLATGDSMIDAIQIIERHHPKKILVLCAIASQAGIERVVKSSTNIEMFPAAIDPTLNDKGYIVSKLGGTGK